MTLQQTLAVPAGWPGSLPEYLVYTALIQLGKQPGLDFVYQSPLMGGRLERGGLVIDFLFINPPDLAINVQGEYFHQQQGSTAIARDKMARAQLAGQGITLIFIDAGDVTADPVRYVRDALNYIDHSFLGRG
jgi:hypothetical protein